MNERAGFVKNLLINAIRRTVYGMNRISSCACNQNGIEASRVLSARIVGTGAEN